MIRAERIAFFTEIEEIIARAENLYQEMVNAQDINSFAPALEKIQADHLAIEGKIKALVEPGEFADLEEDHKILVRHYERMLREVVQPEITLLKILTPANIHQNEIQSKFYALQALKAFFLGRSAFQKREEINALAVGAPPKNAYTYQYEKLVKRMIRGENFKLKQNEKTGEYFVSMRGKRYNLTEILKYANLTQIELSKKDGERYLTMLATLPMIFKPAPDLKMRGASEYTDGKAKIFKNNSLNMEQKNKKGFELLDKVLLNSVEDVNKDKPEDQKDYGLAQISPAQRLAINIYTTGFFDFSNPLLRGDINRAVNGALKPFTEKNGQEATLRELLCTTAFVVNGITFMPGTPYKSLTFRGDDELYEPVLEERLDAAQKQKVISLNSIVSTSKEDPSIKFAFRGDSKLKVGGIYEVFGRDISAISSFMQEKEVLSVSRHKQYEEAIKVGDNAYLFKVRDVATLSGLAPKELLSKKEMKKAERSALHFFYSKEKQEEKKNKAIDKILSKKNQRQEMLLRFPKENKTNEVPVVHVKRDDIAKENKNADSIQKLQNYLDNKKNCQIHNIDQNSIKRSENAMQFSFIDNPSQILHAKKSEEDNILYSVEKNKNTTLSELENVIAKACNLAVLSAEPGMVIHIPEGAPHAEFTHRALQEAIENASRTGKFIEKAPPRIVNKNTQYKNN